MPSKINDSSNIKSSVLLVTEEDLNALSPMDQIAGRVLIKMGRWKLKSENKAEAIQ